MTIDLIGIDFKFEDHVSVTDRIQVTLHPTHQQAKTRPRQSFDRHAMLTPQGRLSSWQALQDFSNSVEQGVWHWAADTTYAEHMHKHFDSLLPVLFPKTRRKPRAAWLSEVTWDLLAWSRRNRRAARNVRSHIRGAFLRQIFQDWRACCESQQRSPRWLAILHERVTQCIPDNAWLKAASVAEAIYFRQAVRARQQLRVSLQRDEAANLEQLAADRRDAFADLQPGNMWHKLKDLTPKWRHMHRNRPVKFTVAQQALATHFGEVEAADLVPLTDVS